MILVYVNVQEFNYKRIYIVIVPLFAYILDCRVSALLCNYLCLDSPHKRNYAACSPGKDPLIFLKKTLVRVNFISLLLADITLLTVLFII